MRDIFSREVRSYTMSRIRKTNTKPELLVRSYLFKNGFRFRVYNKKLFGNPDIVIPKYKIIIFVNGCFWHAHKKCKYSKMPKSNTSYWIPKILKNVERDVRNKKKLKELGWKVLTIWECELEKKRFEKTMKKTIDKVNKRV